MDWNRIKRAYAAAFPYAGKRYWYLRSFQLITQIFMTFLFWGMLTGIFDHSKPRIEYYYNLCSILFYIFFLWSLRNTIRKSVRTNSADEIILNQVRVIKWVLLLLCAALFVLKGYSADFVFSPSNKPPGDIVAYHLVHTFPGMFNPNIGFLIITFLAFYLSEILTIAKKLKEEQSLTI